MHGTHIDTGDTDDTGERHAVAWFEACVEHLGDDDGPCARCGWLDVDHTAGLAVVIEVGRLSPAPLRRAS